MKTLMIVTEGRQLHSRAEMERREAADESPRTTLFARTLNVDLLGPESVSAAPELLRILYRFLPNVVSQTIEGYRRRQDYDAVISWSERRTLSYALLTKLLGSNTPHVALMYWMSKPKQSFLLRHTHSHIDCIITWSSVQREYAIRVLGIPEEKTFLVRHPVDQKFFRPMPGETDMVCSVGSEMRDYHTLIMAMKGLDIRCHIAARDFRVVRGNRAVTLPLDAIGTLPPNVTSGFMPYPELRELYVRSRFVVVPLLPSDTDNGINAILESMAMGKAVICSRTRGQVDAIEEGKTGIFVDQGDPRALREAIEYLLAHLDVAERMGRAGREHVERYHTLDGFVETVRRSVQDVIDGKNPQLA